MHFSGGGTNFLLREIFHGVYFPFGGKFPGVKFSLGEFA